MLAQELFLTSLVCTFFSLARDILLTFFHIGVAIYFLSPLWPYAVSTALTLDSRPTVIVDLTDLNSSDTAGGMETVKSSVVWSTDNLPNTMHTLRISVGIGQQNAIVDGIM
jgi:hypothetical protein